MLEIDYKLTPLFQFGIRDSSLHFLLHLLDRGVGILCQNQEVVGSATLNLLVTKRQVLLDVVGADSRVVLTD